MSKEGWFAAGTAALALNFAALTGCGDASPAPDCGSPSSDILSAKSDQVVAPESINTLYEDTRGKVQRIIDRARQNGDIPPESNSVEVAEGNQKTYYKIEDAEGNPSVGVSCIISSPNSLKRAAEVYRLEPTVVHVARHLTNSKGLSSYDPEVFDVGAAGGSGMNGKQFELLNSRIDRLINNE